MTKVTGIGGLFFRARDPEALGQWYADHLGIDRVPSDYETPCWQQEAGPTVFAPFPDDTDYFGDPGQGFMVNFRVVDIKALVAELEAAGAEITRPPEQHPNGWFAHVKDPEGNSIELWEPAEESGD